MAGAELARQVQGAVAAKLSGAGRGLAPGDAAELARHLAWEELSSALAKHVAAGVAPLSHEDQQGLVEGVISSMFGLGPALEALLGDDSIEQIDINGADVVWARYADGSKEQLAPVASSDEELVSLVRSATRAGLSERPFDQAHPILDLRLADGSRLSAVMGLSERPAVSIRRHRLVEVSLQDLVGLQMMDEELAGFLAAAVSDRANILVGGPTNAGKTTLLRALLAEVPPNERIVTIEDDRELGIERLTHAHPDCVALESRPANTEGEGGVGLAELVRHSLRMAPDRTVLGEVRGGEVTELLRVMSQGRGGSLGTIHADSSAGVFRRLAMYAASSAERLSLETANLLIAGAVHFVVCIELLPAGAVTGNAHLRRRLASGPPWRFGPEAGVRRVVSSVREVVGAEGPMVVSNEVFRPGPGGMALPGAPLRTSRLLTLESHGYRPRLAGVPS